MSQNKNNAAEANALGRGAHSQAMSAEETSIIIAAALAILQRQQLVNTAQEEQQPGTGDTPADGTLSPSEFLSAAERGEIRHGQKVRVRGEYKKRNDQRLRTRKDCYADKVSFDGTEMDVIAPKEVRAKISEGNTVLYGEASRHRNFGWRIILCEEHQDSSQKSESELLAIKEKNGRKDVAAVLAKELKAGEKPSIAIIFPKSRKIDQDFYEGLGEAKSNYKIKEVHVAFSTPNPLSSTLCALDKEGHDAIVLVRGGGWMLNALNNLEFCKVIAGLKTPFICACGHMKDVLLAGQLADKNIQVPYRAGQFLGNL